MNEMAESLVSSFTSYKGIRKYLLSIGLRIWLKDQIISNRGIKGGYTKLIEVGDRGGRECKLANFIYQGFNQWDLLWEII